LKLNVDLGKTTLTLP